LEINAKIYKLPLLKVKSGNIASVKAILRLKTKKNN